MHESMLQRGTEVKIGVFVFLHERHILGAAEITACYKKSHGGEGVNKESKPG